MSDSVDVTTVVFALLALFILYKLRTVLGTRTGTERPPQNTFQRSKNDDQGSVPSPDTSNVITLPGSSSDQRPNVSSADTRTRFKAFAEPKSWQGLDEISIADPSFTPKAFLDGAKGAYETIVSAFSAGDKETLRGLLATEVFDGFSSAITQRENRGEKIEMTFVSLDDARIEDAHLRGNTTQITVRFVMKLITATRDRENNVIDGNPEKTIDITDIWTFSRDATSRDPNWKLIATENGHDT
jgi:predicted lipid-binding transport protein (Tim44 family)